MSEKKNNLLLSGRYPYSTAKSQTHQLWRAAWPVQRAPWIPGSFAFRLAIHSIEHQADSQWLNRSVIWLYSRYRTNNLWLSNNELTVSVTIVPKAHVTNNINRDKENVVTAGNHLNWNFQMNNNLWQPWISQSIDQPCLRRDRWPMLISSPNMGRKLEWNSPLWNIHSDL